nr:polysaccharide biosynthesis C-terminal domain-containing protein [uncultured Gellertiella sp.]
MNINLRKIAGSKIVDAVAAFAIRMTSGVLGYLLFAVIAHMSDAQTFGSFSVLFSVVMTMGMVGSFGQQIFFVKEVPQARVKNSRELEKGSYFYSVASTLLASLACAALVAAYVGYQNGVTQSYLLMIFAALMTFLYGVSQMTIGALRVQDRTLYAMASRDMLWRALAIGLLYLVNFAMAKGESLGQTGIFTILAVTLAPIVLLHLGHVYVYVREHLFGVTPRMKLREWTDTSLGMLLVSVISSSDLYVFTILLGSMVGKFEAGAFFASLKTVELLNMFLMAVTLVTAPEISKAVAKGDRIAFQRVCNSGLVLQGAPAVGACLFIIVLAPYFLGFFNAEFVPFANMLRLLALGMLINALTGATVLILQLIGKHWLQVVYQGGSLALGVVLLPVNIHFFGIYGVAVSFIISKLLWNVLAIITIRKHKGVDPSIFGLFSRQAGGLRGCFQELAGELKGYSARKSEGQS